MRRASLTGVSSVRAHPIPERLKERMMESRNCGCGCELPVVPDDLDCGVSPSFSGCDGICEEISFPEAQSPVAYDKAGPCVAKLWYMTNRVSRSSDMVSNLPSEMREFAQHLLCNCSLIE